MQKNSCVVITDAPQMNYLTDFVSLPKNYGTPAYDQRADVRAIRDTVFRSLDMLDQHTHFTAELKDRRVLIKPNLVSVYNRFGFKDADYPESTDPRVFDAVIAYLKQFTGNIVIIESSGEGMPTRLSFNISGLDRVARHHGITCVALETQPVVRYMLPKAEVMKEVYLPKILDEVVRGEAYYVSVPKMKTNMYTGVTLGFKNAMGTIPYNLRQRNHTYLIHKKLVDLLYLFRPDLTVIDGIIGGEGNTPAPVDPVDMRVIISGTNSVETDRVATRMMGIDPEVNLLMVEAVKKGFHDPSVTIIGTEKVIPFRQANSSIMDAQFQQDFPGVKTLVGHMVHNAPQVSDPGQMTPELALQMEKACDGGCLPATKTAFEFMKYTGGADRTFKLLMLLGPGVPVDGKRYYFDADGKAYDIETIRGMKIKKMAIGECAREMRPLCDVYSEGCCTPGSCLLKTFEASGQPMAPFSLKNKHLLRLAYETVSLYWIKRRLIQSGQWTDCPHESLDKLYEIPEQSGDRATQDYLAWPLPPMGGAEKRRALSELKIV